MSENRVHRIHGRRFMLDSADFKLKEEVTSALLVKPKNTRGTLARNPVPELSHENFAASILQAADLPHEEFGLSYFDIIESGSPQKREFRLNMVRGIGTGSVTPTVRYEVIGDAGDFGCWRLVP